MNDPRPSVPTIAAPTGETLVTRVGRLISGSVNAVVDAVETLMPEAVMAEAVREIDRTIDEVRSELGRCLAAKHMATQRLGQMNTRHTKIAADLEDAVAANRDDLARSAIATQMDIEAQVPVLERAIADGAEKEKELEGYIAALLAKKREMEDEIRSFKESRGTDGPTAKAAGAPLEHRIAANASRAVGAFERVLATQTGLPGSGEVSLKDARNLQELEQLSRGNRIEERLTALKAQRTDAK